MDHGTHFVQRPSLGLHRPGASRYAARRRRRCGQGATPGIERTIQTDLTCWEVWRALSRRVQRCCAGFGLSASLTSSDRLCATSWTIPPRVAIAERLRGNGERRGRIIPKVYGAEHSPCADVGGSPWRKDPEIERSKRWGYDLPTSPNVSYRAISTGVHPWQSFTPTHTRQYPGVRTKIGCGFRRGGVLSPRFKEDWAT